ncbi:hypothetical protein Pla163_01680 [Planctomycetes bacterium Pla163]|uniref:Uncharacterized protein n=2 Tax=Rohdeia mirabilis TaxID=2528008 RepID=A0A518CV24_9BACT|nr:hypothetical protein Pla163_01680 [Planctomycetes bacterium Pla163]
MMDAMSDRLHILFRPTSFFSRNREVVVDGVVRTRLERHVFSRRCDVHLDGRAYSMRPKGFFGRHYVLELAGEEIARVERTGFIKNRYSFVSSGPRTLVIVPRGFWRPSYALLDGEREVGRFSNQGTFGSQLVGDLPADTPLPLALFMGFVCLTVREERDTNASS